MILRVLIALFSLFGISATFMPWLHYPQAGGAVIYGYAGDGIVTGFLFLLILIYAIFTFKKDKIKKIPAVLMMALALLLAAISFSKINSVRIQQENFNVNDPRIARVTAGFHEGIGVYMVGIAGIAIVVVILILLLSQSKPVDTDSLKNQALRKRRNVLWAGALVVAGIIAITTLFLIRSDTGISGQQAIESSIGNAMQEMGKTLANEDYEGFVAFNHPVLVQAYGGKQKAIELFQTTLTQQKRDGVYFQDITFDKILDIKRRGREIQAVVLQNIRTMEYGETKVNQQKTLAVSENGGKSWYFLSIQDQSKDEIKKIFPDLNNDLQFTQ